MNAERNAPEDPQYRAEDPGEDSPLRSRHGQIRVAEVGNLSAGFAAAGKFFVLA